MRCTLGKFITVVLGCLLTGFLYFLYMLITGNSCSDETTIELVNEVCRRYRNGEVHGNLCYHLCDTGLISHIKCVQIGVGKAVFLADCGKNVCDDYRNITLVVKNNNKVIDEDAISLDQNMANTPLHRYIKSGLPREWFTETGDWSRLGILQLLDTINRQSNLVVTRDKLEEIIDTGQNLPIQDKLRLHNQTVSMLVQEEYLFTRLYAESSFCPDLYGTCGIYYAVENTPILDYTKPWRERALMALGLLHLTDALSDPLLGNSLHLCDIKPDNFGVSPGFSGTIKLIDSDMIWQESILFSEFSQSQCTADAHCDIYNCQGICNTANQMCKPQRKNDNLQVICQRILQGTKETLFQGLLHSAPVSVAEELYSLVDKCSDPSAYGGGSQYVRVPRVIKERLRTLLKQSKGL